MPVLYGDRPVARLDSKYDRQQEVLLITGFWLVDWFKPDPEFIEALAKGLIRFKDFLGAKSIDVTYLQPDSLRQSVKQIIE